METRYTITIPVIAKRDELAGILCAAAKLEFAHGFASVEPIAGHSGATVVEQDDGSFACGYRGDGDDAIYDAVADGCEGITF